MNNNQNYAHFIDSKKHITGNFGFEPDYLPEMAFPFQKYIIERAVKKGRMAIFADTGLGKTLMQISAANNIIRKTNKRVLILTPLAVAFQFIEEAEKMGIDDIDYSKNGKLKKKITLCNYERLHHFDKNDFSGVVCDESSIFKNFDGKTKNHVNSFVKKIPYRFLSTATPSPNDFIELGSSSEILGYMGYMDMLTRFFKNNQNTADSNNRNIGEKFYLKPHAENDFFNWVNQWALMVKMPSDLGFSDEGYVLPELKKNTTIIRNKSLIDINGQIQMYAPLAKSLTEIRHEQKQTIVPRCEKAVSLAHGRTSVYWCNLNDEGDLLAELDGEAVQIKGGQSIEQKEEILLSFAKGEIKRLITKPKITSMGLNWQHCSHSVFFPTFSYEQYYQSVRRFWRFGQKNVVTVENVISDGMKRVMLSLEEKHKKSMELYTKLNENLNGKFVDHYKEFDKQLKLPKWTK